MEPQSWIIGTAGAAAFTTLVASAQAAAITSMMNGIKMTEEVFTQRRVAQRYCWRRDGRLHCVRSDATEAAHCIRTILGNCPLAVTRRGSRWKRKAAAASTAKGGKAFRLRWVHQRRR
jgi:hypothetical protein